jgi:hypothetical protein
MCEMRSAITVKVTIGFAVFDWMPLSSIGIG